MSRVPSFLQRLAGATVWKTEWQKALNEALKDAQRGLSVNMVVVIARESDFYAELLFLLCVSGLALGVIGAAVIQRMGGDSWDMLVFPLAGFALGSLFFGLRGFFLHRFAPKAVRERVANRAKAQFFDHEHHLKGRLVLLYFSELEREALLLSSAEITEEISAVPEIPRVLSRLVRDYRRQAPVDILVPTLRDLGEGLRLRLGAALGDNDVETVARSGSLVIEASDRPDIRVPLLKGSKDIN